MYALPQSLRYASHFLYQYRILNFIVCLPVYFSWSEIEFYFILFAYLSIYLSISLFIDFLRTDFDFYFILSIFLSSKIRFRFSFYFVYLSRSNFILFYLFIYRLMYLPIFPICLHPSFNRVVLLQKQTKKKNSQFSILINVSLNSKTKKNRSCI